MSTPPFEAAVNSRGLLKLPNELLLRIAKAAPSIEDILALRLVGNDRLARAGLDAIHQRMTRIYIEQARDSIQRFRDICADESRARYITEIVYVASLLTLTDEEVRGDNDNLWNSRSGHEVTDDLKDEVAALYHLRKAEQQGLLEERSLEKALVEVLPQLPNLKKICFARSPRRTDWKLLRTYVDETYNLEASWRWNIAPVDWDEESSLPDREQLSKSILGNLIYDGAWHEQSFDNPIALFRALGALGWSKRSSTMELDFYQAPMSILDDVYAAFVAREAPLMVHAMANITAITFVHYDHVLPGRQTLSQDDLEHGMRWATLLSKANRLKSIHFNRGDHRAYRGAISAIFRTEHTWPELESIWIELPSSWVTEVEERGPDYPTYDYHDRSLIGFLKRHRKTLKDLKLTDAVGTDHETSLHSATSLHTMLDYMKSDLPALETARITVTLYPSGQRPSFASRGGEVRPDWRDRDLKAAAETNLDQLARSVGAERMFYEVKQSLVISLAEEGHATEEDSRLSFKYEFGPYVLGNPAEDRTREVHVLIERGYTDMMAWRIG